jgi:hypothetical protein
MSEVENRKLGEGEKERGAVDQAVSRKGRRLTTAVEWIRSQVSLYGIYGRWSKSEEGFLTALRFPLPILVSQTTPYSVIILPLTLYSLDTATVVKQQTKRCTDENRQRDSQHSHTESYTNKVSEHFCKNILKLF